MPYRPFMPFTSTKVLFSMKKPYGVTTPYAVVSRLIIWSSLINCFIYFCNGKNRKMIILMMNVNILIMTRRAHSHFDTKGAGAGAWAPGIPPVHTTVFQYIKCENCSTYISVYMCNLKILPSICGSKLFQRSILHIWPVVICWY